jgi:hypothetical protein
MINQEMPKLSIYTQCAPVLSSDVVTTSVTTIILVMIYLYMEPCIIYDFYVDCFR